jgi:hypothetical protein
MNDEIEVGSSPPMGRSYLRENGKYIFYKDLSHQYIVEAVLGEKKDKKFRRSLPWIRITVTKKGTYIQIQQPITHNQLSEIKNIITENEAQNRNTIFDIGSDLDIDGMRYFEKILRTNKFHPSQNL